MVGLTTADLSSLPEPGGLRRLMQSLAMLDAILSPEWDYRYYSFNAEWGPGEMMGSMRNGSGDDLFVLFSEAGCLIKGFDHEAADPAVRADAFYAQLPPPFDAQALEPAFSPENVTFCYWCPAGEANWRRALVPAYASARDGSDDLLSLLDGNPASYRAFARDYFERELDASPIEALYRHTPLTETMAQALNAEADWPGAREDAAEIGYPLA